MSDPKRGFWLVMAVSGVVMGWAWWADWWDWWVLSVATVVWGALCVLLFAEEFGLWVVAVWVVACVLCVVLLDSWPMWTVLVGLFSAAAFVVGMKIGFDKGRTEGQAEGWEAGWEAGLKKGLKKGRKEAEFESYVEGHVDGAKAGLKQARELAAIQEYFYGRETRRRR